MSDTRRHHVYWGILAVSFGLVGAMLGAMCGGVGSDDAPETTQRASSPPETPPSSPDAGVPADATSTTGSIASPPGPLRHTGSGPAVQFVHPTRGRGVFSLVLAGAPGMWPPEARRTSARGVLSLPETDVETIDGESLHTYELMARAPQEALGYWGRIHLDEMENSEATSADTADDMPTLALQRAATIDVTVLDSAGEPVSQADVRLSRQQIGFVHLQKRTDAEGRVDFRAIPAGTYRLSASKEGRRASRVLEQDIETGRTSTLTLEPRPEPAIPSEAAANSTDESDSFVQTTVDVTGLTPAQWKRADVVWRREGESWRNMVLDRTAVDGTRRWSKSLQPGTYTLQAAFGPVRDTRMLEVGSEETSATWHVQPKRTYRLFVVDEFGTPVPGALVQIWRKGERIASTVSSSGEDPIEVELGYGRSYHVVALDSRKGEGVGTLETAEADPNEYIVTLDQPLYSSSHPPNRITGRGEMASILGASLVRDEGAWVIERREPESPARRVGLQRGDRLVSLRPTGGAYQIVVDRKGMLETLELSR